ncbi:MAG: penicillin-binding transpeptidase domain-containing protein [Lachnospiraceae bacterium]|nr:penicillin-binding transpeptidase domain-containing protein [Lachnospiraceae bacterium]
MFDDLREILKEFIHKIAYSRLFALMILFTCLFGVLGVHLFNLQIVQGEDMLNNYIQQTEQTVYTPGTRGNIYDKNGKILAYNELAYSVTIQDTGAYRSDADMNAMLLRLVQILEKHEVDVQGKFEIGLDENGEMIYTSYSETGRKGFLRDVYGKKYISELDEEWDKTLNKYAADVTARELFEKKKKSYKLDEIKDEKGNTVMLDDRTALSIVNIRYTMSLTSFQKYLPTTVAAYVDDETVAEVMENTADLQGVDIAESSVRVYNDSIYFAPIIGYTGKMQKERLEELQKSNPDYDINDTVGLIGIESSMELKLQGQKGYRVVNVDNRGRIREEKEKVDPVAGHDIYLTIDSDLQKGIYHLIEQQLAGILVTKLVPEDEPNTEHTDSTNLKIPIKDAYYQLINNNVLSLNEFEAEDASDVERQIQSTFEASREQILAQLRSELMSENAAIMKNLPKDMANYMVYIYSYLSSSSVGIIDESKIDTSSKAYLDWKADEISLRDYLHAGIADSWIDTTKLNAGSKYSSADDIYSQLVDFCLEELKYDTKFTKRIYRFLINDNIITGKQLCLALYDQGVLPEEPAQIALLRGNGEAYAYTFLLDKISKIQITPAQLALDPCSGGCVITDVNTGEVRALVTYPSYDNNRMSGTVDSAYFSKLQNDLSQPLYNNATQAQKAPGSTFKPITAIAGLEEGVIQPGETIRCTGIYQDVAQPIKCWIYPGAHGPLDVVGGLQNSCNSFVNEVAHRLSIDENGIYNTEKGLELLRKYAVMFGLDHDSGVEISERDPEISDIDPERSAMGQGTNSFTNIQLSRYVAALANQGTVFELSLLDKETDSDGNLVEDFTPEISSHVEIADSTWNAASMGMRGVIQNGSASKIFKDLPVHIAGKTGTAQESRARGNHAFFISYGPYENPEICVTVNIPYGYSSSNAATVAKHVYQLYYGYTSLDEILNTGALETSNVTIGD